MHADGRRRNTQRWRRRHLLPPLLLTAGCMIGPDFKTPKADVAAQWLEADHAAVDSTRSEYQDWWNVFADPTLTSLIGLAYQQNLTLRAAGVRVLQARAELGVALGELYPQQQNVSASVSRNRVPLSTPFEIMQPTYWSDVFGAQAAWEIDVWGKLRRGIQSADWAYLASVAGYDDVLVTLTGDVASTYVQIRVLQAQLAIARENVARQKQALDVANFRFKAGAATERDVFQAENVLGSTEAAVPEALLGIQTATNALRVLLGLPPGPTDEILGGGPIPIAPERAAVGIPAELLRRRPDVRKAELDAAAQCAQIGFAKADLLPALTLVGNVGTMATDIGRARLTDVFTQRSLSYSVGPAVQWNILNYGQLSNDVRVQDAKFQALIVEYQNKVLQKARDEPGFLRIGFTTFNAGSPQVHLDIDRTMARALGVTVDEVMKTLQTALGSSYVNLFNKFNQSFQVRVQAGADHRREPADIGNLSVPNQSGQMVPLGAVLGVRRTLGAELIPRFNTYPAATLTGIPMPKYSSGQAMQMMEAFAKQLLPQQIRTEWAGLSYQEQLVGNQAYLIFGLSITLVFLVLAAQYESWLDPVAVILTVPMSLVGIVIALVVRKFPVDLYTQIGLVLMTALAAKNAILIVEFARELTAGGMTAPAAAVEATRRRFRPILMTSTAFILGVVPMLTADGAGSASQQALGTVVFGGMLASTLVAIPFVPVFFVLVRRVAARRAAARPGLAARSETAPSTP